MAFPLDKAFVPVLMYHQVLDEDCGALAHPYQVALSRFRRQLRFLKQTSTATVLLEDLVRSHLHFSSRLPTKRVALTFDDGYIDNYQHAFPALRQFGMKATFFVIVNKIGTSGFMTWEQLREMQAQGMSIQSHTLNHHALSALTADAIMSEVYDARQRLEHELRKKIEAISFPHGSYDGRVLRAAKAAGYRACCTSDFGYYNIARTAAHIPRLIVRPHHGLEDFRSMVCSSGARILSLRAGAALRRTLRSVLGFQRYQFLYEQVYRRNGRG